MENDVAYYCLGFTWKESEPKDQLPKFIKKGIWENRFEDKYVVRVNSISVGSKVAAKVTFSKKKDGKSISMLRIHAIGTVTRNFNDGHKLKVKWETDFVPFEIENKGGNRSLVVRVNSLDTIREIFGASVLEIAEGEIPFYLMSSVRSNIQLYPCFQLARDNWDDFGYRTQYDVYYHEDENSWIHLGKVKFLDKETDSGDLPDFFTKLEDKYCSLGQGNGYYSNLREKLDINISKYYLDAVNDIALYKGFREDFEYIKGYKISLLRSSEAQKSLREGAGIYVGQKRTNSFNFNFSAQIGKALEPHSIRFKFSKNKTLPFRIKVLIGKNGTGKTQYLSKLASTLSGFDNQGKFDSDLMPAFSRVITISYSLFDRFPRPEKTKGFSYYYCGFRGGNGFLTHNQINTRFMKAIKILKKSNRIVTFGRYLALVLTDEVAHEILNDDYDDLNKKLFTLFDEDDYSRYSSGQVVIILVLAELLAYVTEESLVLIDEPETHLHPNSISLFIDVINKILGKYESYAIIATHSPQVVQEVPAKDIVVLERYENVPSIRPVGLETFGENLNTITQRIFDTISNDEYYRSFFKNLSSKQSYEFIVRAFEDNSLPLSLNAKMYLQSLYEEFDTTS